MTRTDPERTDRRPSGPEAPRPSGLWRSLAAAADAPAVGVGDVWRGLERRLILSARRSGGEPPAASLWAGLRARVDPALYRPCAIPNVPHERVTEDGQTYTVIRSPRGAYLRLTPPLHEIWRAMDGTRTVAQLATEAFMRHGQLLPVGELVATLRAEGFLTDSPGRVYSSLKASLARGTAEGRGRRALRFLTGRVWRIGGLDAFYGALYRGGGRLLFTPWFALLAGVLIIAGVAAFGRALLGGADAYQVISMGGSVALGLAALWAALFVSFVLHESAHALAVKHYGRTIHGGGLMLYYGLPAAFVDTSDVWRSPRRARIVVSAAGPLADLLVGSVAALVSVLLPETALGALAFKVAFTSYASTLFNLNPLLELDGYFILVDLLRLPDLRRRSFAFIRGPLWRRLAADDPRPTADGAAPRAGWLVGGGLRSIVSRLTREERIFTLYGLGAAAYTAVALAAAGWFWYDQVLGPTLLLLQGGPWQRLLGGLLLLTLILPVLLAVLLAVWGLGSISLRWVLRRGYGRRPALFAAFAVLAALAVTALAARAAGGAYVVAAALWGAGLWALLALRPDYRGAAVAPALLAMAAQTVCALLAALLRVALPDSPAWLAADGLGFVFLLLAGFTALLDVDLRLAPARELLATALLLMLSFAVGGSALVGALAGDPGATMPVLLARAAPAYFGALALALLLPHLFGLRDSRLFWAWLLLWLAALVRTAGYVTGVSQGAGASGLVTLDVLSAALWAAAWAVHLVTLRQIAPDEIRWPHEPSLSEAERLLRAFRWSYAGCYRLLRTVYGERRARALDDRMDVLAATANWDVALDRDRARVGAETRALPLGRQGARYAEVLRYTVDALEQIAGAAFARRAIQAAYDALPWPERETANRLCFPDTPWARELSSAFGDARSARLRLLRQVDLFIHCDDGELEALAHGIAEQRAPAGTALLRAGQPVPGVWIVEAGEVAALRGEQVEAELHRGDSFGAQELLRGHESALTYVATVETSLLFLPADELRALAAGGAPHAAEALEAAETLRLFEQVPLFAELPRNTLRGLAMVAAERSFDAKKVVVRQGVPSGTFYIIKEGLAAVLVREQGPDGAARVRQVARLGPREFFGELELLRGTPPMASVVSLTPLVTLALPHAAVHALLLGNSGMAREMELVGSGRLLALRNVDA